MEYYNKKQKTQQERINDWEKEKLNQATRYFPFFFFFFFAFFNLPFCFKLSSKNKYDICKKDSLKIETIFSLIENEYK